ncbi:hypothetical protein EVAR_41922_1 [Eumeta japonica]|uniref:Secreted protein n=1 Tax=Eumeta variegata TaxID=151549 RepID=A0A4C1XLE8_EUMVA|nr:hypothetical protein EVAR_41922_1 [Eumeta japonica]
MLSFFTICLHLILSENVRGTTLLRPLWTSGFKAKHPPDARAVVTVQTVKFKSVLAPLCHHKNLERRRENLLRARSPTAGEHAKLWAASDRIVKALKPTARSYHSFSESSMTPSTRASLEDCPFTSLYWRDSPTQKV